MNSMTGFGRGIAERGGASVVVEVAAVNSRKQTDIRVVLPRELSALEPLLRQRIQERVSRGTLNVTLQYTLAPEQRAESLAIDVPFATELVRRLRELAAATGVEPRLSLADLLQVPGVLSSAGGSPAEAVRDLAVEALDDALDGLRTMQLAEGEKLGHDIANRLASLKDRLESIAVRADEALLQHRDRLRQRIALLGVSLPLDDERLAREVAFYAEKSDITEEVVRLRSHLERFGDLLEEDRDVGRELEFLCQELSREASTIAAKTTETAIAEVVVALKAELTRVREQVLNVE
jgi:uncharacterized protein (TIGR00255 family)